MSGHSKWATIHRAKEVKDAARGKLFSRLARAITIAAKTGGGPNPESNFKLRVEIDKARAANMPKENIERAISKGSGSDSMIEVSYEGFGPGGIELIVDTATDNRNRTGQEIKNILERGGGSLGGPHSVSFNFSQTGFILVKKAADKDAQLLALIDLGIADLEEVEEGIEVYTPASQLYEMRKKIEAAGFSAENTELIKKPITTVKVDEANRDKVVNFLETLEDQDDVLKIYTNATF